MMTASPASRTRVGTPARATMEMATAAWTPNAQICSRGVRATQITKANVATTLASGASRCTGEWPCTTR